MRCDLKAAAGGLIMITAINTIRIGSLSLAVDRPELFNFLHHFAWPAILIIAGLTAATLIGMPGRPQGGGENSGVISVKR